MYRLALACFLLAAFCFCAPALADSIYASNDTFVKSNEPDANLDNNGLWIGDAPSSNIYNVFVEFTLGSDPVSNATLRMYQYYQNWWISPQSIRLVGALYAFDETTLTWNNQPDASAWDSLGTWQILDWTQGGTAYYQDLTSFYNDHLGQTVTIRLNQTSYEHTASGYSAGFEDREGTGVGYGYAPAGNAPRIDTSPIPEPGSLAVFAVGLAGYFGRRRRA